MTSAFLAKVVWGCVAILAASAFVVSAHVSRSDSQVASAIFAQANKSSNLACIDPNLCNGKLYNAGGPYLTDACQKPDPAKGEQPTKNGLINKPCSQLDECDGAQYVSSAAAPIFAKKGPVIGHCTISRTCEADTVCGKAVSKKGQLPPPNTTEPPKTGDTSPPEEQPTPDPNGEPLKEPPKSGFTDEKGFEINWKDYQGPDQPASPSPAGKYPGNFEPGDTGGLKASPDPMTGGENPGPGPSQNGGQGTTGFQPPQGQDASNGEGGLGEKLGQIASDIGKEIAKGGALAADKIGELLQALANALEEGLKGLAGGEGEGPTPTPSINTGNPSPTPVKGNASTYGGKGETQRDARGQMVDPNALTAAHKTLPLNSYARVTNLANGRSVDVKITDRGPYVAGRIIDLTPAAARAIGMDPNGIGNVSVQPIPAPGASLYSPPPSSPFGPIGAIGEGVGGATAETPGGGIGSDFGLGAEPLDFGQLSLLPESPTFPNGTEFSGQPPADVTYPNGAEFPGQPPPDEAPTQESTGYGTEFQRFPGDWGIDEQGFIDYANQLGDEARAFGEQAFQNFDEALAFGDRPFYDVGDESRAFGERRFYDFGDESRAFGERAFQNFDESNAFGDRPSEYQPGQDVNPLEDFRPGDKNLKDILETSVESHPNRTWGGVYDDKGRLIAFSNGTKDVPIGSEDGAKISEFLGCTGACYEQAVADASATENEANAAAAERLRNADAEDASNMPSKDEKLDTDSGEKKAADEAQKKTDEEKRVAEKAKATQDAQEKQAEAEREAAKKRAEAEAADKKIEEKSKEAQEAAEKAKQAAELAKKDKDALIKEEQKLKKNIDETKGVRGSAQRGLSVAEQTAKETGDPAQVEQKVRNAIGKIDTDALRAAAESPLLSEKQAASIRSAADRIDANVDQIERLNGSGSESQMRSLAARSISEMNGAIAKAETGFSNQDAPLRAAAAASTNDARIATAEMNNASKGLWASGVAADRAWSAYYEADRAALDAYANTWRVSGEGWDPTLTQQIYTPGLPGAGSYAPEFQAPITDQGDLLSLPSPAWNYDAEGFLMTDWEGESVLHVIEEKALESQVAEDLRSWQLLEQVKAAEAEQALNEYIKTWVDNPENWRVPGDLGRPLSPEAQAKADDLQAKIWAEQAKILMAKAHLAAAYGTTVDNIPPREYGTGTKTDDWRDALWNAQENVAKYQLELTQLKMDDIDRGFADSEGSATRAEIETQDAIASELKQQEKDLESVLSARQDERDKVGQQYVEDRRMTRGMLEAEVKEGKKLVEGSLGKDWKDQRDLIGFSEQMRAGQIAREDLLIRATDCGENCGVKLYPEQSSQPTFGERVMSCFGWCAGAPTSLPGSIAEPYGPNGYEAPPDWSKYATLDPADYPLGVPPEPNLKDLLETSVENNPNRNWGGVYDDQGRLYAFSNGSKDIPVDSADGENIAKFLGCTEACYEQAASDAGESDVYRDAIIEADETRNLYSTEGIDWNQYKPMTTEEFYNELEKSMANGGTSPNAGNTDERSGGTPRPEDDNPDTPKPGGETPPDEGKPPPGPGAAKPPPGPAVPPPGPAEGGGGPSGGGGGGGGEQGGGGGGGIGDILGQLMGALGQLLQMMMGQGEEDKKQTPQQPTLPPTIPLYDASTSQNKIGNISTKRPIVALVANPSTIEFARPDKTDRLTWGSVNTDDCTLKDSQGTTLGEGRDGAVQTVALTKTTTFYITCQGASGATTNAATTVTVEQLDTPSNQTDTKADVSTQKKTSTSTPKTKTKNNSEKPITCDAALPINEYLKCLQKQSTTL